MVLVLLDIHMQNKEVGLLLDTIYKKWIKDLKCKSPSIKLLGENIEVNFHNLGFGGRFLDMTIKAWATKEKLHIIEIKNFYASKDTIDKVKSKVCKVK